MKTRSGGLDYEEQTDHLVEVTASDGANESTIKITIKVTDVSGDEPDNLKPSFNDGPTAIREVAENSPAGTDITAVSPDVVHPVSATDDDEGETLTYALSSGAASFDIVSTSGQLQTKAGVTLDHETKDMYTVEVTVTDGKDEDDNVEANPTIDDTIMVTIMVTDVDEAPVFTEGSTTGRLIPEDTDTSSAVSIGTFTATDPDDGDTVAYAFSGNGNDNSSFTVDSDTGELEINAAVTLNYEIKTSYRVVITATSTKANDNNGGSATITVTIDVADENEAPSFSPATLELAVDENTPADTDIVDGVVALATDPEGDPVTYTYGGLDEASFNFVPDTTGTTVGKLQTKAPLDFEGSQKTYTVTVEASDDSGESETITITITVTPVNEPPKFASETAIFSIKEDDDVDSGRVIGTVVAEDPEEDTISYDVSDTANFAIDSNGQLTTSAALDYEMQTDYAVTVTATSNGGTDTIEVTINVLNISDGVADRAPEFIDGPSITFQIDEVIGDAIAVGTNVGRQVTAKDRDGDIVVYTDNSDDFDVDSSTGQLTTVVELTPDNFNYEPSPDTFEVTITATSYEDDDADTNPTAGTDTIVVTIEAENVNEAPTFGDDPTQQFSIDEDVEIGASLTPDEPVREATDVDAGDEDLMYALKGTSDEFAFDPETRKLTVKGALDYETLDNDGAKTHEVTVTATDDEGAAGEIVITIIVNAVNEAPEFADESVTRRVFEGTAVGQNVGAPVTATDEDESKEIVYSLKMVLDYASFAIDSSGQLTVGADVVLDYEARTRYEVVVLTASNNADFNDPSRVDEVTVTIEVTNDPSDDNDAVGKRAPMFREGRSTTRPVDENSPEGTNIGDPVSATDEDGDTLTYGLGGDDAASFDIVTTSGQLQTKAGVTLDHERRDTYMVDVTVHDGKKADGEPYAEDDGTSEDDRIDNRITVTIMVGDVNEAPTFLQGDMTERSVPENTKAGQDVGPPVLATDEDEDEDGNPKDTLVYSIVDPSGNFTIEDGQLKTADDLDVGDLDHETQTDYLVTVGVRDEVDDSGTTPDVTIDVTIRVLDVVEQPVLNSAPAFPDPSITFIVNESADTSTLTFEVPAATDAEDDDEDLTYALDTQFAHASFDFDPSTRMLTLKAGVVLDSENDYTVMVTVTDSKDATDTIRVIIEVTDANDRPTFPSATTTRFVLENTASGVAFGIPVAATDADDTSLTYTLGGTDATSFSIDSTSGQLMTSAALDLEVKNTYTVTVSVTDGKDANDAADNMVDASIEVTIWVTTETVITPGPSLPPTTGGIWFFPSSIERTVAENTKEGVDIGAPVAATVAEGVELTSSLTYGLFNSTRFGPDSSPDAAFFSIVPATGQLQTKFSLDSEFRRRYYVRVTVTDQDRDPVFYDPAVEVTIYVTNVNEAPVFKGVRDDRTWGEIESYTFTINENAGAAQAARIVRGAEDPENDTVAYTFGGPDAASFDFNGSTRELRPKAEVDLNHEAKGEYTVTVTASDGRLSNTLTITITISDVDEAPAFDSTTASFTVPENADAGTNIGGPLTAIDPDDGDTVGYSLIGPDQDSFDIDVDDEAGTVQLETERGVMLDYESRTTYTVTLKATSTKEDGRPGGTATITVTITVTDENDAPEFTEGETTEREIAENTAANVDIGSLLVATDEDRPAQSLTYSLAGPDAASFGFVSTSSGGQLKTRAALDYESRTDYAVTVTATDDGSPRESSTIMVTIRVANVEVAQGDPESTNSAPRFDDPSATFTISENMPDMSAGRIVGALDVIDDDVGETATLTYRLGGTDSASFNLDELAIGADRVAKILRLRTNVGLDLNHETKPSYMVTVTVTDSKDATDTIAVTIEVTDVNESPVFAEPSGTTRSIAENTQKGVEIGPAVSATDPENLPLTYTVTGTNFEIDEDTGQLKTNADLSYERQSSYTVTVTASDGESLDKSIRVTIHVINANEAPMFSNRTFYLSIEENTEPGEDIDVAVTATDDDIGDTVTYTLGGPDAASFDIVPMDDAEESLTGGQLQTKGALDYETKRGYMVEVTASDDSRSTSTVVVTIGVTNVDEAPEFARETATFSIAEGVALNRIIGSVVATDPDADDTVVNYDVSGTTFGIGRTTGQLTTDAALDYETQTDYAVTVTATDANPTDPQEDDLTATIKVTINVLNVSEPGTVDRAPVFIDGPSMTFEIEEVIGAEEIDMDTDIGGVIATDPDGDTVAYSLTDNDFEVNSSTGQLTTKRAITPDYEATNADYEVTITATSYEDDDATTNPTARRDTIVVTIKVTNVNEAPTFTLDAQAFDVSEAAEIGASVGMVGGASDIDKDDEDEDLVYTLKDTSAEFAFDSETRELTVKGALNFEAFPADEDKQYEVTVTATDDEGAAGEIVITITVADVDEAPMFTGESVIRNVLENTAEGQNVGTPVTATDADSQDTGATYTLKPVLDHASFEIDSTSGQLTVGAGVVLNYEARTDYEVMVIATDKRVLTLTDEITVIIKVTDDPSDDAGANHAPVFTNGRSTTRSVNENTQAGQDIGLAVAATDEDGDTITYALGGADAASFNFVTTSGQLQTKDDLNHETIKNEYTVTVTATDDNSTPLSDTIAVTIMVMDVNEAPTFVQGDMTEREIAENVGSGVDIGTPVAATDVDRDDDGMGDTLTYSLDAAGDSLFEIDPMSGQLRTEDDLDYETQTSYTVTVTVMDDGVGTLSDTIRVDIKVLDVPEASLVNRAPVFDDGASTIRTVDENSASGTDIGDPVTATDANTGDVVTYSLGGTDMGSFSIVTTSGQLQVKDALDFETLPNSYTVTVTATDNGSPSRFDQITVTIRVTNVVEIGDPTQNRAPEFASATATRSIPENTVSGVAIETPVAATDVDNDALTYSLGGTDAGSFGIDSGSGQLRTQGSLNYETKSSYTVTVSVTDNKNAAGDPDSTDDAEITVTITVTNVVEPGDGTQNRAPVFASATATRSIPENTASGVAIETPVAATDVDNDSLTYSLGGTDAGSFGIDSGSGQLTTQGDLDYETKSSYTVTVSVTDNKNAAGDPDSTDDAEITSPSPSPT